MVSPWKFELSFESISTEHLFRLLSLHGGQLKASSKMQIRFGTGFALDLPRKPHYLVASFSLSSPLSQGTGTPAYSDSVRTAKKSRCRQSVTVTSHF